MAACQLPDPDDLLTDLDPAQREAVTITSGPLCILAGAGSGKTRVISRRVAYALATGVVRPRDVLVVTFTDKAAGEMAAGSPRSGIGAWRRPRSMPRRSASSATSGHASTARDPPEILASKAPILAPLAAGLPGGYRYLAVRDLAAEIEWAKARRIGAGEYEARAHRRGPRRAAAARPHGRPVPPLREPPRRGPGGSTSRTCSNGRSD